MIRQSIGFHGAACVMKTLYRKKDKKMLPLYYTDKDVVSFLLRMYDCFTFCVFVSLSHDVKMCAITKPKNELMPMTQIRNSFRFRIKLEKKNSSFALLFGIVTFVVPHI